jgi:toxin YoeB
MYKLEFSKRAEEDIARLKKSGDAQAVKKLTALLKEIEIHPETGTGKPERLKHELTNKWSRHISVKHRLIYEIFEHLVIVEIVQTYGHYGDK